MKLLIASLLISSFAFATDNAKRSLAGTDTKNTVFIDVARKIVMLYCPDATLVKTFVDRTQMRGSYLVKDVSVDSSGSIHFSMGEDFNGKPVDSKLAIQPGAGCMVSFYDKR